MNVYKYINIRSVRNNLFVASEKCFKKNVCSTFLGRGLQLPPSSICCFRNGKPKLIMQPRRVSVDIEWKLQHLLRHAKKKRLNPPVILTFSYVGPSSKNTQICVLQTYQKLYQ